MNESLNLHNTAGYKSSVKGNEKIFLPINEVLNQARIDQASNSWTLNEGMRNSSSSRKNKPSLLDNTNSGVLKELGELNRSRGLDLLVNDRSLTQEKINDIKRNLNLMNIQKSVLGSSEADKRESRPSQSGATSKVDVNAKVQMHLIKKGLDNSSTNNVGDFNKLASTSFNLTKASDHAENYDFIYPVLSHHGNNVFDSNSSNPNSKKKLGNQSKSPYNVHSKKKQNPGSSK